MNERDDKPEVEPTNEHYHEYRPVQGSQIKSSFTGQVTYPVTTVLADLCVDLGSIK
jgi:hypothetical protein